MTVYLSSSQCGVDIGEIAQQHEPLIRNYFRRQVSNEHDIDDLTQEVLLVIAGGINSFRQQSSLTTWIYGICRNVLYRYYLSRKKQRVHQTDFEFKSNLTAVAASNLPLNFTRLCVEFEVEKLPEIDREIYQKFYRQELSIAEISSSLGLAAGTVKFRLFKIRNFLKSRLS